MGGIVSTALKFIFGMSIPEILTIILIGACAGIGLGYLFFGLGCRRLDTYSSEPTDRVVRGIKSSAYLAGAIAMPLTWFILLLLFSSFNINF